MSPPHVIVSVLASAWLVSQKKDRKTAAMVNRRAVLPPAVGIIASQLEAQLTGAQVRRIGRIA